MITPSPIVPKWRGLQGVGRTAAVTEALRGTVTWDGCGRQNRQNTRIIESAADPSEYFRMV